MAGTRAQQLYGLNPEALKHYFHQQIIEAARIAAERRTYIDDEDEDYVPREKEEISDPLVDSLEKNMNKARDESTSESEKEDATTLMSIVDQKERPNIKVLQRMLQIDERLLNQGCGIKNVTPLYAAIMRGHYEAARALIMQPNINLKVLTSSNNTIFHALAYTPDPELLEHVICVFKDKYGESDLAAWISKRCDCSLHGSKQCGLTPLGVVFGMRHARASEVLRTFSRFNLVDGPPCVCPHLQPPVAMRGNVVAIAVTEGNSFLLERLSEVRDLVPLHSVEVSPPGTRICTRMLPWAIEAECHYEVIRLLCDSRNSNDYQTQAATLAAANRAFDEVCAQTGEDAVPREFIMRVRTLLEGFAARTEALGLAEKSANETRLAITTAATVTDKLREANHRIGKLTFELSEARERCKQKDDALAAQCREVENLKTDVSVREHLLSVEKKSHEKTIETYENRLAYLNRLSEREDSAVAVKRNDLITNYEEEVKELRGIVEDLRETAEKNESYANVALDQVEERNKEIASLRKELEMARSATESLRMELVEARQTIEQNKLFNGLAVCASEATGTITACSKLPEISSANIKENATEHLMEGYTVRIAPDTQMGQYIKANNPRARQTCDKRFYLLSEWEHAYLLAKVFANN